MNKAFSIYLDLVRFSAACLVYLWHSNQRWLVMDILPASNYGHSSVIVFFVLSGFVIAYVTAEKENTPIEYFSSRMARVYSVVIPAVILTLILDYIGRRSIPDVYSSYPFDQFPIRILASTLFCNEIWFISITSFSNVPFWSICYEVWYYICFGLLLFLPRPWAYLSVAFLALIVGPKIILLAPIWGLGVLLYRWHRLKSISKANSWFMFFGGALGIVLFHWLNIPEEVAGSFKLAVGDELYRNLTFSKFFLSDYILGPLVFIHFVGARNVISSLSPLLYFERPIRFCASYTFSLYLLHQPLFLFWGSVLKGDPSDHIAWMITTVLVVSSVLLVGFFTENRRYLLKRFIKYILLQTSSRIFIASKKAA
jgi:peptidoglycan/LPS O-acetylase OafA/YrhL